MKFSYNWLQSYFTKKLPEPNKLADILTMHSFEVEEVLKKGRDWILDIDILPNRAHDCLSYSGLAREVAALTNYKQTFPHKGSPGGRQSKKLLDVKIQGKSLVPRYTAYVIEGVSVKQSPNWMKERLAGAEQKSINNIVDITNYIMWDTGQPLHAFDFDKIKGGRITIRESKNGEKIETLDGETHPLSNSDIIIEDTERIIDLAGIKGGGNTQIDKKSKTVVFQAAIFDPVHIRRTTQRLSFRTDAAARYIHGFDTNIPPNVLDYAFLLLRETNPDARLVQAIDIYPNPVKPKTIQLDLGYVSSLLGVNLSKEKVSGILRRLGFEGKRAEDSYSLFVTIPTFRLDIENQEDVVEEIGRVFGYENIPAKAPTGILSRPTRNYKVFWRTTLREVIRGFGFSETYNYSLISKPPTPDEKEDLIELENPVSDEFRYMRPLLLFGALKNFASNSRYFDSIKLFEFGKVFFKENNKIKETENLLIASNEKDGFYMIKGYIDELLRSVGITNFYYTPMSGDDPHGTFLHEGRRAGIVLGNKFFGFVGEVDSQISSYYDVNGRVVVAELDFDSIVEEAEEEHEYEKPSKYPEVARDISLLVPPDVMVADVLNAINSVSGPMLRDIDLFDIFEGENLPSKQAGLLSGMKSFAFHLLFQSDKRTLTSGEIDDIMKRIVKTLQDNLWEVR